MTDRSRLTSCGVVTVVRHIRGILRDVQFLPTVRTAPRSASLALAASLEGEVRVANRNRWILSSTTQRLSLRTGATLMLRSARVSTASEPPSSFSASTSADTDPATAGSASKSQAAPMQRVRRMLRELRRLPAEAEARVGQLLREVVRAPRGDDVLPARLVTALLHTYRGLDRQGRLGFLSLLACQFGVDDAKVSEGLESLQRARAQGSAPKELQAGTDLRLALVPQYELVMQRIAQQPGGLRFLVELRADVVAAIAERDAEGGGVPDGERPQWRGLDASLQSLLSVWFDTGLLQLVRLAWDSTPAILLERIIRYERVHPMKGFADLRRRLGARQRIFAFLHPRMELEPLVFVQLALRLEIASHLDDVLAGEEEAGVENDCAATEGEGAPGVAVFYSISSHFGGLRGVPLGRLLIKQVVEKLREECPELHTFVTLSPVPGFRQWLTSRYALLDAGCGDSDSFLDASEWDALTAFRRALDGADLSFEDPFTAPLHSGRKCPPHLWPVRDSLLTLLARYLCLARKRQQALDSVAGFHLRNGARILALRWLANPTTRGCLESAGMMVNYHYELSEIESNHSRYVGRGEIAADARVVNAMRCPPNDVALRSVPIVH